MKRHEWLKYIYDIKSACERILRFTEGKSFDEYCSDEMLQGAVERQYEIIGEALNKALQLEPGVKELITDYKQIIALRNRLIHGYEEISNELIWGTIKAHLPILIEEINGLLE